MYVISGKSIQFSGLAFGLLTFSNFVTSRRCEYEKPEKHSLQLFGDQLRKVLVRHSFSRSDVLRLLRHVIVVNVEHHVLLRCHSTGICELVSQFLLSIAHEPSEHRLAPDISGQSSRQHTSTGEKRRYEQF